MGIFDKFFKPAPGPAPAHEAAEAKALAEQLQRVEDLLQAIGVEPNPHPQKSPPTPGDRSIRESPGPVAPDVAGYPINAVFTVGFQTLAHVRVHPIETFTERVHTALMEVNTEMMAEVLNSIYSPQADGTLMRYADPPPKDKKGLN